MLACFVERIRDLLVVNRKRSQSDGLRISEDKASSPTNSSVTYLGHL